MHESGRRSSHWTPPRPRPEEAIDPAPVLDACRGTNLPLTPVLSDSQLLASRSPRGRMDLPATRVTLTSFVVGLCPQSTVVHSGAWMGGLSTNAPQLYRLARGPSLVCFLSASFFVSTGHKKQTTLNLPICTQQPSRLLPKPKSKSKSKPSALLTNTAWPFEQQTSCSPFCLSLCFNTMEPTASETPNVETRSTPPVKRRVSRACDQCHRTRTRCNGQAPCSRCTDLEHVCQYNREKKKRGKVPRHIQKQREEAAVAVAGFSPRTPEGLMHQIDEYAERPVLKSEAYDEMWSQPENAPIMHHFPTGKGSLHEPLWTDCQGLYQGAPFAQPYNHTVVDPLFLDSEAAYSPTHGEMPHNPDLMFAMSGMHLPPTYSYAPVSMPPTYVNMGYSNHYQVPRRSSP